MCKAKLGVNPLKANVIPIVRAQADVRFDHICSTLWLVVSLLSIRFEVDKIKAPAAHPKVIMFDTTPLFSLPKVEQYQRLAQQARVLMEGETDRIANAANLSALVMHALPDLNWAGFYFYDGTELVLGPFQGKPACLRIQLERGVCGAAARTRTTQLVPDVHAFPGHIACDAASRSEIVVPLVHQGRLVGVWDVDSPIPARFDVQDQSGMETLCQIYLDSVFGVR